MIDTVFGVTLTYLFHRSVLSFLSHRIERQYSALSTEEGSEKETWMQHVVRCGDYGDPPSLHVWTSQMIEWVNPATHSEHRPVSERVYFCLFQVIVTLISRFVCGGTIFALREFVLIDIATFIDRLFSGHPHLLLFAVMVLCPVLMNLIQAWIQDNILKWRTRKMITKPTFLPRP